MAASYRVALVVDPAFGDRLLPLAQRVHAWAVDTPSNKEAAERFWAALPDATDYDTETGITTFLHESEGEPEQCCADIIGSLDDHHNQYAHTPGYTVLEVYGARPTDELKKAFKECGFVAFDVTDFGFLARK